MKRYVTILFACLAIACGGDKARVLRTETPDPVISAVDPAEGPAGTLVTIVGNHFGNDPAVGRVLFGTQQVATMESWANQTIKVRVPKGAGSTLAVMVREAISNRVAFAFTAPAEDTTGDSTGGNGDGGTGNGGGGGDPTVTNGVLTGTVFHPFGYPVTGARVMISSDANFSQGIKFASTANDGTYSASLTAGDYYVKASLDVNGNTIFFETGLDAIGWNGPYTVDSLLHTTGADVNLDAAADGLIRGRLSDADGSWGSSVTGVATMDRGSGVIRYAGTVTDAGFYTIAEVRGNGIGVVAYRDLDGDGRFDFNVEPAITVSGNVAADAVGVDAVFPSQRMVSGTVTNGEGWTIYLEDRTNNDPAGNRWHVGTQVLPAGGAFSIAAVPTDYRIRAFQDTNGNGIVDANENRITIQGTFSTLAGDPAPFTMSIPPNIVVLSTRVTGDANGDGYLAPGESGRLEVTLLNEGGAIDGLSATALSVANVTLDTQPSIPAIMATNQQAVATLNVTAHAVAPGEQLEIDLTINGNNGYNRVRTVFVGIFNAAPYAVSVFPYAFTDISSTGVQLPNAESEQNSEFLDLRPGGPLFASGNDFLFPFYGSWVTDGNANAFGRGMQDGIEVGDNGYLSFVRAADVLPIPLPGNDRDAQMTLAPLWSSFVPGQVWALLDGVEPHRVVTIQWSGLMRSGQLGEVTMQVRLHELSGIIDVAYQQATLTGADQMGINYGDGLTWLTWSLPATTTTAVRLVPTGW